jgi:peroxiredoxin Q/BCP
VTFFAASVDDLETNTKFAQSLDANYPILADPEKTAARAYGVVTDERPAAYRWTFYIGKDGRILHIDKAVKIATAGEDVAAKLAELGVDRK